MNDHDDYFPQLFIQYPKKSIGNRSGNHSKVSLPFQWNSILDRKRKKKDAIWNCLFLHEESGKKGKINLYVVYSSIPRLSVSPENWISVCLLAKHIINFARLFGTHNYSYRQLIRIPAKHFFMPNPSSSNSPNHFTISKFQGGGKKKSMTKRRNVLDSVELGMCREEAYEAAWKALLSAFGLLLPGLLVPSFHVKTGNGTGNLTPTPA